MRINVRASGRTYPVLIQPGLLSVATRVLAAEGIRAPATIVSSPPIWRAQGKRIAPVGTGKPVLMPDGERAKTLGTIARLYEAFAERNIDRAGTIVAFGGGVVGDVAGFAAATYLRGLTLVQVPTTVLAQVDSAVGGKVGINLRAGKNLAGAFHPPAAVLIDPEVLTTLPDRELRAGLYEVVKYGVIASEPLFSRLAGDLAKLLARDRECLTDVVAASCRIKALVVEHDEREAGPRRVLNFGHTVGHALEAVTGYRRFRHGEAVAYGMLAAARLSVARGAMPAADEARLAETIGLIGRLPRVTDLRASDIASALARDKKIVAGRLHFVLCAGLGRTSIVSDVTPAELRMAIRSLGPK